MEGVPLREPEVIAKKIMLHLKKFPFYLLDPSNTMIGKIVSNAFEGMAQDVLRYPGYTSFNELKPSSRTRYPSTDAQSENAWWKQ